MTHKIVETQDYLLVVDETATINNKFSTDGVTLYPPRNIDKGEKHLKTKVKTIIGHLPLNNAPVLVGVDLLPELKNDLYDEALAAYNKLPFDVKDLTEFNQFLDGYKAATKTYSEGDLRIAFGYGYELNSESSIQNAELKHSFDNLLLFLNKPKLPVGFEAEYNKSPLEEMMPEMEGRLQFSQVKTIPNEQGIPVWQGTYIYENSIT